MEAVSIGAALLLFISLGVNNQTVYKAPGTVLVMPFPAYILLQLIPLPMGMVKLISPSTYSLYSETIEVVDPVSWVSLSINKKSNPCRAVPLFILCRGLTADGSVAVSPIFIKKRPSIIWRFSRPCLA
jgi:hypothetical protein